MIGRYLLYNPETADILSEISGPESQVKLQGFAYAELPPEASIHTHHVVAGRVVPRTVTETPPDAAPVEGWEGVRRERGRRLAATDWTQLPDVPATTRLLWQEYRQQLRDITLQVDPLNIEWPKTPQ